MNRERIIEERQVLGRYWEIFLLQYDWGLRITEVLNIQPGDIARDGSVWIKGLKGSNDRIVFTKEAAEHLLKSKAKGMAPFSHCNRFTARNLLQRLGFGLDVKNGKNQRVTSAFRHNFVAKFRDEGKTSEQIKSGVGHRSAKSTEHYGKKK